MRRKILSEWGKQNFWFFGLLLALFALSACETPNAMSVRAGLEPKYVDDHVRFRSRYYYTVIEHCSEDGRTLEPKPKNITLYRYTLTGKAPSLFTKVKFEAGLMPTEIVEKFGTELPGNEKPKKPDANNSDDNSSGDSDSSNEQVPSNGAKAKDDNEIEVTQLDPPSDEAVPKGDKEVAKEEKQSNDDKKSNEAEENPPSPYCYKEVYISGPEGTIRDDDTKSLVLSMTTSASPLIQSLGALNNLATVLRDDDSEMMDSVMLSSDFKSEQIIAQQIQQMLQKKTTMAEESASLPTPDQVEELMRSICAMLGQKSLAGGLKEGGKEGGEQCPEPQ